MSDGIALSLEQLLRPPTLAQLLPSRQVSGRRTGMHQASSKGRGMEFAEVRPYLSGDDVRSIDWRITARTGKPHTKLFREERDRSVYTLLDLDPGMYFGSRGQLKARLATILAAATAWQALAEGDKVGGLILLDAEPIRHPPAGRRKELLLWLQKLAQAFQSKELALQRNENGVGCGHRIHGEKIQRRRAIDEHEIGPFGRRLEVFLQRRAQPVAVVQHEQVAVLVVHVAACVVPQPDHEIGRAHV